MYQRNINILQDFEGFDFNQLKPRSKLIYQKKPKDKSIVAINGLSLFAKPHHVFIFIENDITKIGAIWFVAKLRGLKYDELAMITELLYRYLDGNYSNEYEIANDYCIAVDVNTVNSMNYAQLNHKKIKSPLVQTVGQIKKLL